MVSELFPDVTNESEISGGGIGRRRGGRRLLRQPFHFVFPYAWREEGRLDLAAGVVIHRQHHFFSAPNVQAIGQARGRTLFTGPVAVGSQGGQVDCQGANVGFDTLQATNPAGTNDLPRPQKQLLHPSVTR